MGKIRGLYIIQLIYLIIPILYTGCNGVVKTHIIQSSFDVKQSKELGVFLKEYIPLKNKFILGANEINIKEVWVENYWVYKNQRRDIEKMRSTKGYVKIDTELCKLSDVNFIFNNRRNDIEGNKLSFYPIQNLDTLTFIFCNKTDSIKVQCVNK